MINTIAETLLELMKKSSESCLQITLVLACCLAVTGWSAYSSTNAKLEEVKEQSNRQDAEIEKRAAEQKVLLETIAGQVETIHSFYVNQGLRGRDNG